MSKFVEIVPEELNENVFRRIGAEWMLITAGDRKACNTMTASWGGLGVLWGKPVAYIFVRPNRHTVGFINDNASLTLSFMPESHRADVLYCGRHSGRDTDKMANTNLRPVTTETGLVTYEDAELVLECRKMFKTRLQEADFLDWSEVSPKWYAEDNPLHDLYICEITRALVP